MTSTDIVQNPCTTLMKGFESLTVYILYIVKLSIPFDLSMTLSDLKKFHREN